VNGLYTHIKKKTYLGVDNLANRIDNKIVTKANLFFFFFVRLTGHSLFILRYCSCHIDFL
jgi:hypothetical protein